MPMKKPRRKALRAWHAPGNVAARGLCALGQLHTLSEKTHSQMLLFRWIILFSLLASVVCFMFYAGTGQSRFRHYGLVTLKWTLIAAFGFFAVLILERVA